MPRIIWEFHGLLEGRLPPDQKEALESIIFPEALEFHCYSWVGAKGISLRVGGWDGCIVAKIFMMKVPTGTTKRRINFKCYIPFCILLV